MNKAVLKAFFSFLSTRHKVLNIISVLKLKGYFVLDNGYKLNFNHKNKRDVVRIFLFAVENGVEFSDKKGFWSLDFENNLIITSNGIKFKIEKFSSCIFSETFLFDIHFLDNVSGKIIIQAGGFTGDTALYYASKGAVIYSFEPDPNSFRIACENISLNQNISNTIVMKNYAIGKDEIIDFPVNESGSGDSSVYELNGRNIVQIRSASISKILEEFDIREPYLLDLDIKGNEFEVINDKSIAKFQKVRIEYSPLLVNKIEDGRDLLIHKLGEYGFKNIRVFKHNDAKFDLHYHGTIQASRI